MKKRINFKWDIETITKLKRLANKAVRSSNKFLELLILKQDERT